MHKVSHGASCRVAAEFPALAVQADLSGAEKSLRAEKCRGSRTKTEN
jgi:hypothetical protein